MDKLISVCGRALLFPACVGLSLAAVDAGTLPPPPRYPADLCIDPEGRWIFTANEGSGSVSMVAVATGEVVDEVVLDPASQPRAIAIASTVDGRLLLAVSETFRHRIAVLSVDGLAVDATGVDSPHPHLRLLRRVPVGRLPAELCFTLGGGRLLVACEGDGEVWELDLQRAAVVRKLTAVEGVRRLVISAPPHETSPSLLTVAGRLEVAQLDLDSGALRWKRRPAGGKAFNLDGLAVARGQVFVAHQIKPTEAAIEPQMIVWGLVIANRLSLIEPPRRESSLPLPAPEPYDADRGEQVISLDARGGAAGDPTAVAILPDRRARRGAPVALVTSGGTDRLLVVDTGAGRYVTAAPLSQYQPLRAVRVGNRPVAIALGANARRAYVACYLDDSIVEVDLEEYQTLRTLRLGPPAAGQQHAGARIFFDANRSRGGWYSCHSCHPHGETRGHLFDTSADGDGLAKKSPDLRGTSRTGPWSWLGRFEVLQQQVAATLETTMAVDHPPRAEEVEQVIAFLDTLKRPVSSTPGEDLGGDAGRGKELFQRGDCHRCHRPPTYTIKETKDVGVSDPHPDPRRRYNPPSLLGLRDRYRYLHDGRAETLWAVFREHNSEEKHGEAGAFSDCELRDLIAFLKTL